MFVKELEELDHSDSPNFNAMPVRVRVTMSSEEFLFTLQLDSLLAMVAGGMLVVILILLFIMMLCMQTCSKRGLANNPKDAASSPIPTPPPMPASRMNNNNNAVISSQPIRETSTFTTPVWFEEIHKNSMFSKIRIELADQMHGEDSKRAERDPGLYVIDMNGSSNI